jgi:phospholipase C
VPAHQYGIFQVDHEVVGPDTIRLSVSVVVPAPIPTFGGQALRLGSTIVDSRRPRTLLELDLMNKKLKTGFLARVSFRLDVGNGSVQVKAHAESKVLGKEPLGPWNVEVPIQYFWPRPPARPLGKAQVAHVVVVMMENRSFDNMLGWLYAEQSNRPPINIPSRPTPTYEGLVADTYFNYSSRSTEKIFAARPPTGRHPWQVPDPDPNELFDSITAQIFGQKAPSPGEAASMGGFVKDYQRLTHKCLGVASMCPEHTKPTSEVRDNAAFSQIMQSYGPKEVPVLSALARSYAVCDGWYASAPCQTWPNRAFVHAGSSGGKVNNCEFGLTDCVPLPYDIKTVFNALEDAGKSWCVYYGPNNAHGIPLGSLVRAQFLPRLGSPLLNAHFRSFEEFKSHANDGLLPAYSFVEPCMMDSQGHEDDEHPPHDVRRGEHFLYEVWKAVSSGREWQKTLLIITYDEHGGCYDHMPPPWTAVRPDTSRSQDGSTFAFNRFGVRVPAVVVSPHIEPGTVFRSATEVPYDHTSILATLRDWLQLPPRRFLASKRVERAPTLASVLTLSTPRSDLPAISPPAPLLLQAAAPPLARRRLTSPQLSLLATAARQNRALWGIWTPPGRSRRHRPPASRRRRR